MTIEQLIAKVAEEKPNSFTEDKLISFVNEIEVEVAEQLNVTAPEYTSKYVVADPQPYYATWNNGTGWYLYDNGEYIEQTGEEFLDGVTYYALAVLLAPAPYDRLYVSYLKSQIDYANEEYPSYQLNAEQHVQDFMDFSNWVVRTNQESDHRFPCRFINVF